MHACCQARRCERAHSNLGLSNVHLHQLAVSVPSACLLALEQRPHVQEVATHRQTKHSPDFWSCANTCSRHSPPGCRYDTCSASCQCAGKRVHGADLRPHHACCWFPRENSRLHLRRAHMSQSTIATIVFNSGAESTS